MSNIYVKNQNNDNDKHIAVLLCLMDISQGSLITRETKVNDYRIRNDLLWTVVS